MRYYAIRVYDGSKVLTTRTEKASGPRKACKLAFGVIYDSKYDTARYCDLGTRSPKYMPAKAYNAILDNPDNWKPIPKTGD